MDVDEFLDRLRVAALWLFFGLGFAYLLNIAYEHSLKYSSPPEYMSGLLVFEDQLKCGIVRTQNMDRFSCKFSGAICSELKNYNQRKIRIMGQKVECSTGNDVACSSEGDYSDSSFDPSSCYTDYRLTKVFEKENIK